RPKPAPIVAQHRLTMKDPRIGSPVIMKIYRAPRGSDSLEIMTEIFGGSSTSRLYKILVVDRKLAISAGADYNPISLNDTTLTIYASPTPDTSLQQLEDAIDAEVRKLTKKGITIEELKSAKSKKKASLTYYLDSLQGPAILFGRAITSGFDMDYLENWNERVEKLTIDDVNKSANTMFSEDSLPIIGILLPQKKPENAEKK
ncbi:MAG: insulinase family protein, partial [Alphaproteobacteria bacterium]|nr:insulinase family protein [Alphaproteobacteria bacterium]MCK5555295.1 insulinase family protein [Alphaproteobacteria bacterium]